MKRLQLLSFCFCVATLTGCYSTARHVANVRPELVKADAGIAQKYRLARIVLKKSAFSSKVAGGYEQFDRRQKALDAKKTAVRNKTPVDLDTYMGMLRALSPSVVVPGSQYWEMAKKSYLSASAEQRQIMVAAISDSKFYYEQHAIDQERKAYDGLLKEDRKSGPNGTHAADTKILFDGVKQSLLWSYPKIFTEETSATPIAVVVDWATSYKARPDYASIFSYWFWPNGADQESIYFIWVTENDEQRSNDDLWKDYLSSKSQARGFIGKGSAVRESEIWETGLLPLGLIPVPGESDWPKTTDFMRCGKGSLVGSPKEKIESRHCFRDLVFEPATDGDVLAAAIMRVINRWQREKDVQKQVKGGAR